ncbi:6-phosphogluconate dehydrogenase [Robiginitalea myxolifaciens]|uniref:6-phosphogluconate dehydrogenase, decarboxylating n=1 Tax=Robiginitalea myxolifaciens TaxID=400055 RepID=A0A1I6FMM6_9FLAO|nr:NADP-dependent phosphogluconate dehydrogenase [Robiginitalea myxolifaciens]SFR31215.1 6-phosphogluconate dehydrogenase [Robiginitalea myxolifaciens]
MSKSASYTFGLVGLGVMGRNFILNVADNGFSALGYDLDEEKARSLREEGGNPDKVDATSDLGTFVAGLSLPRKIMLLVPAGNIVDRVIEDLLPLLDEGDIIVDGGNSFFRDTDRRETYLKEKGINFFGAGVSGGAEGARRGPSIMPGGNREAYAHLKPIFEAASAKYKGEPCVAYLGPKSSGNYVKMVHNGIEYGLMQLTAEIYELLKTAGRLDNPAISDAFHRWDQDRLESFLVSISATILKQKDDLGSGYLVDKILDKAKQKGTGKWTSQNSMDLGIPMPTIDMAVSMRQLSALKDHRETLDERFGDLEVPEWTPEDLLPKAEAALYFAFIMTYAQGLHLLTEASEDYEYNLNMETIAKIWRAGCIIRAELLADIAQAYGANPELPNLVLAPELTDAIGSCLPAIREVVAYGAKYGISIPCLSSALSYFDAFSSGRLPLNLVQAQRDYFGSHTYERTDQEGIFHTEWPKG